MTASDFLGKAIISESALSCISVISLHATSFKKSVTNQVCINTISLDKLMVCDYYYEVNDKTKK